MERTSCHTIMVVWYSYLGSLFYTRKQVRGMIELANVDEHYIENLPV